MPTSNVKENARKLIERLPDDSTWDDIMYEMYVRQKIERGLQDAAEGKTTDHEEVKKQFTDE